MARLYSARPKAVRPRSKASRGVAWGGDCRAGVAAKSAPARAASRPNVIPEGPSVGDYSIGSGPQFHDVAAALAGADANLFGRECLAGIDRDLDLLAGVVVGEKGDVDLLARVRRGRGRVSVGIPHHHACRSAGGIGRHEQT